MNTSKNALPVPGFLFVVVSFKFTGYERTFNSVGESRIHSNVRKDKKIMIRDSIFNAVTKKFPSGLKFSYKVTMDGVYDINIKEYNFVYNLKNYKVVKNKGRYYEQFDDDFSKHKGRKRYALNRDIIKDTTIDNLQ